MTKQISILIVAFCCFLSTPIFAADSDNAARIKNMFPIGIWYDGRVEGINCPPGCVNVPAGLENAREYYKKTFTDIKQHGIDIVVIPNTPPQYRETLLSTADEVGVKIVLELVEIAYAAFGGDISVRSPYMLQDTDILRKKLKAVIDPLRGHESLLFYQTVDEPSAEEADNLQKVTNLLAEIDPAHPTFSCMCRDNELWRTANVGMNMIVFDRYPIALNSTPENFDFKTWKTLLDLLHSTGQKNDIPYWMVLQTFSKPDVYRFPTVPELRAMTYLSLSRNAKGIFFFLYNSRTQGENMQGLVDTELNPAPLWPDVAKLAGELKTLSPVILDMQPTESFASCDANNVDVQCFADEKGEKYIIATNIDLLKSADAQLKVEGGKGLKDMLTGENTAIEQLDQQTTGTANIKLTPGNGVVLQLRN